MTTLLLILLAFVAGYGLGNRRGYRRGISRADWAALFGALEKHKP